MDNNANNEALQTGAAQKPKLIDKLKKQKKDKPEKPKKTNGVKKELTKLQKIWIGVGSVAGAFALAAIIIAIVASASNKVNVYNVSELAMMDSWMYQSDSSGNVTGENMQTIYLSDTQRVTEVFVEEGQEVKVGDKLMSYDTTLSNLELEKKNLEVLQLELALSNAKSDLYKINALKPFTPPPEEEDDPEDLGELVTARTLIGGTGTQADPYIYIVLDKSFPCDNDSVDVLLNSRAQVYVIFEARKDNMSKGEIEEAWGVCFKKNGSARTLSYFDPIEFITEPEPEPTPDDSSGFTAQEIAEMRKAQMAVIKEAEISYRVAYIAYQQMLLEVDTGIIESKVDGVVTLVGDPDEALLNYSPFIKVAGGDGYRISATVSEFMLEKIELGQPVTIMSWDNGMSYQGEVVEIITMPSSDNYYYGGISSSYYPVMISVGSDADLYEHQYVQVTFNLSGDGETSLFMPDAFIRTEKGRSYAFIMGENGRLEKRELITGASLWGSYTEIISGFTVDDRIAFPYGSKVKEGAKAVESTLDKLYGSMY